MAEDPQSTLRVDADTGSAQSGIKGLSGIFGGLFGTIAGGVVTGNLLAGAITGVVGAIGSAARAFIGFIGDSMKMNATLESTTMQFATLMGDADAARSHVKDLFEFAKKTPFETGPIILASRTLETFGGAALNSTKNLTLFGDAAAATSAPIEEVSMWSGRLYAQLQAGRPFGEAAQRLGELAIMTPRTRMELEAMQKSGATGQEIWAKYQESLGRFTGAMEKQSKTWGGLTSSISDSIAILSATAFAPFFDMAKAGLEVILDLLGSQGMTNAAAGMGKAFGDAFRIIRDAFGPVIKGFIETAKGAAAAADGSSVFGVVVKGIIGIVATFMQVLAGIVRAIATVIQAYFEFRVAGNLLLMAFGKIVEGILWGTLKIAEGMAKVSFGETRKSFERDAESLRGALAKVQADVRGLSENTEQYRQKSEATGRTLRGFADGLDAAAKKTMEQGAAYKYTAPVQDEFSKKTRAITEGLGEQGGAASKSKEKISEFANTASAQIAKLHTEWQRQPPAIRANAESVNILLDKYEKLRKDVTDKSKLPAELEYIYIMSGRAVPVIAGLGKEFANLGTKIPIPTMKELTAMLPPTIPVVSGLGKEFENLGTKIPLEKLTKLPETAKPFKEVWSSTLDTLSGAFEKLANIAGGTFGGITKYIGETIGAMKLATEGGKTFDAGMTQLSKGGFQNVASGAASMAAGIFSGIGAMQQATNHASATKNVLGGMATGMSMGMQIAGPWGAAVGAAVGAIWGAFKGKPDWAKIQSEIQRDFGVAVTEALAKEIEKTNKTVKDRATSILMHLSQVIQESGGITVANLDKWTKETGKLFDAVAAKKMNMQKATEQFNAIFPQMAKVITETNGLASASFMKLIAQHDASMMKSGAVAEFIGQQMGKAIAGLKAFVDNATITSQNAATATGAAVAAMFDKMVKGGMSASDALKALGPVVTTLEAQFAKAGFTGGEAFDSIKALAVTASNEIVSKGITAVSGLNDMMRGLHNTGILDQQMFSGLSQQIGDTFNSLIAQGYNGDHVLRLMQPTLQTLHEMQRRFGYTTDESTQALLDQARASGVVGDQYMSAQDRMAAATDRVANAIEFMAGKMGYLPQIADHVAGRVGGAFGNVERQVYSSGDAFERWRRKAVDAAHEVGDAVDEVSFGSSPGGIKEWILLLAKSSQMFGEVSSTGAREIQRLKREVNAFGSPGIGFDVATAARVGGGGMGGGLVVNVDARSAVFEEEASVRKISNRVGEQIATNFYRGVKAHTT